VLTSAKRSARMFNERKVIDMDLIPRNLYNLDDIFDHFMPIEKMDPMKCDIYEKDGNYHIELDVPGFKKEDINIEIKDGHLNIVAEKNSEVNDEDKDKKYIRRERSYGKYQRSFAIGEVDPGKITAEFTDGTLKIVVPKQEAVETKRRIEIQ